MKARWKFAIAGGLLAVAGVALAQSGVIDDVRDGWRDLKVLGNEMKARAREMVGMRGSGADMGCPMGGGGMMGDGMMGDGMMGGGMMSGGMMGGGMMGGAPNEQWRDRGAARPADPDRRAPR